MGIYIKGLEMPTGNECLILTIYPDGQCFEHVYNGSFGAREERKAVPVPEHGRLGDLDRLEQMFVDIDNAPYSGFDGTEPFYSAEDAAQIIRLAPTVIPASEGAE